MDVRAELVESALNGVAQSVVLLVVVWLCMRAFVRVTATARVFVWSLVAVAMMLLSLPMHHLLPAHPAVLRLETSALEDASPVTGALSDRTVGVAAAATALNRPRAAHRTGHSLLPRFGALRTGAWVALLAWVWLGVALVLLVRVGFGVAQIVRLKRASRWLGEDWQSRLYALCVAYGVKRRVIMATTTSARSPMLLGVGRPLVLVSDALMREMAADQIELVLLHEVEHLRRRHDWAALIDAVLRAIFFFHLPLLWVLRRLELEREMQCDEAVLQHTGQPAAYAAALMRVAQMSLDNRTVLAPGALLHPRTLTARFHHILAPPPRRSFTVIACVAMLSVFAVTTALVARSPRWIVVQPPERPAALLQQAAVVGAGEKLDRALSVLERDGFAGGVMVVRGGNVVLHRGYGLADRARGLRHDTSTLYDLAGVTKAFTAAAILQLEADGKLRTDERVARYIGALPGVKADATIEQLLQHRGGLTARSSDVQRTSRAAFLQAVRDAPVDFAAGTRFRYTDIGYSVLASVIERVSGMSYETYVQQRLMQPAGMTRSGFEDGVTPRGSVIAKEYAVTGTGFLPAAQRPYVWGRRGALGLVAPLDDLYRWQKALDAGDVLPRAQVEKLYGGLGYVSVRGPSGHVVLRRLGGTPTFQAELLMYPDDDVIVAFAINNRVGWHLQVWRAIESALFDEPQGAS